MAILTKNHYTTYNGQRSEATVMLRDEGRWNETCIATKDGRNYLFTASLYGVDGASKQSGEKFRRNDTLIAYAMTRMLEVGDVPYILGIDLNITPEESFVARRFMGTGKVIDVPAAFGLGKQHTFATKGPEEGVDGARARQNRHHIR